MTAQVAVRPTRRVFTVAEYEHMGRVGVLSTDDRVELLDGEIVEMTPIGPPHAGIVNVLTQRFVTGVGERAVVAPQNPIRLSGRSQPQPDVVIAKPRSDSYRLSHPVPDDVLLIIEVSSSSLDADLQVKLPLYAIAGIAELWIVDINASAIHVYRKPREQSYAQTSTHRSGAYISPTSFPDLSLDVSSVVGPHQ